MDLITLILGCSMFANNSIVNAMIQIDSNNTPLMISGQTFKTSQAALAQVNKLRNENRSYQVGLLQVPSRWFKHYPVTPEQLLRPCKNVAIASEILVKLDQQCQGDEACMLSMYKTGDPQAGLDYANQIIDYAKDHPIVRPPSLE